MCSKCMLLPNICNLHGMHYSIYTLTLMQDGTMPIHLASVRGKVEMVRALIRMGSSPTVCAEGEVCDINGKSAKGREGSSLP